ncbi:hypothetical protein CEP52_012185 [Fusarium oligoseptatum]|uniref:Uncharacterized protein n=1 Tax=Fusarium oligoseptatum TaxID=2604345 RepID=A0A428SZF7_9HYPO|nr:hypothetical protein CEP52_012185 [Fusarium oligoseptatum]
MVRTVRIRPASSMATGPINQYHRIETNILLSTWSPVASILLGPLRPSIRGALITLEEPPINEIKLTDAPE